MNHWFPVVALVFIFRDDFKRPVYSMHLAHNLLTYIMQTLKLSIVGVKASVSNKWGISVSFTFCFLLPVNIASYHSPSRAGIFFFFHKTPFIFYPRTLSTPTSHHKSINIRKLSDISCSVQWTSNTFFNTFLNLESSQIKIWKLCVSVIFSLAFQKCFKLSAWSWRFACFFAVNAGTTRNKSSRLLLLRVGII